MLLSAIHASQRLRLPFDGVLLIGYRTMPIWPADWSQFFPDLILSIVGGVVIGLFVWRLQARSEDQAEKRRVRTAWSMVKAKVSSELSGDMSFASAGNGLLFVGALPSRVVDLFDNQPIAYWAEVLDDDHALNEFRLLMIRAYEFKNAAAGVEPLISDYWIAESLGLADVPHFIEYARLRVADQLPEYVMRVPLSGRYKGEYAAFEAARLRQVQRYRVAILELHTSWEQCQYRFRAASPS